MALKINNNAFSKLTAPIAAGDLVLNVTAGDRALFPSLAAGEYFYSTLTELAKVEIIKVTARTADNFTIVRGQDGTIAQDFGAGARIDQRWNRAQFVDLLSESVTPKVVSLSQGISSASITFSTPKLNTNYSVHHSFECNDANPIFLSGIVKNKTVNGFDIVFNAATDSSNYKLNYSVGNT